MPAELDPAAAEVNTVIGSSLVAPGKKIHWTNRRLQESLSTLVQEAYAMGFLAGQKQEFLAKVSGGAAERPEWTDIPLDDPRSLARYGIRPVVIRSLIGAGYRQLGDLCWVSDSQLRKLFYIGRVTTRKIRTVIRQCQSRFPQPVHQARPTGRHDHATKPSPENDSDESISR